MIVPDAIARVQRQQRNRADSPEDPPVWAQMSPTEQFARGVLTLRHAFSGQPAFSYWATVSMGIDAIDDTPT